MSNIRNLQDSDRFIVYKHTNKINGKSYIGITKRTIEQRVYDGYAGSRHFNSAISKYGWENFETTILEENLTCDEACSKEKYYIEKYDSINNGYNLEEGGIYGTINPETRKLMSDRMIGNTYSKNQVFSEEAKKHISEGVKKFFDDPIKGAAAKKKISEANKGKIVSEETREKMSKAQKGRTFSEETINKMKEAAMNRKVSEETKKKLSESLKKFYSDPVEKQKISERFKGKKRTPEQIEHYRQAALNRTKEHQDKINKALKERRDSK
jgi:group I intron endonuclease